jgi:hypothetical protein
MERFRYFYRKRFCDCVSGWVGPRGGERAGMSACRPVAVVFCRKWKSMAAKRLAKPTGEVPGKLPGLPAADSVAVRILAGRTGPGYRYLVGEVRAVPRLLAEQFIKERAAMIWAGAPVPVKIPGKDDLDTDADEPAEPKADEPEAQHVRIADRMPKAQNVR